MRKLTIDATEAQSFEATEPGPYPMTVDEISDPAKSSDPNSSGNLYVWVYFAFADPTLAKKCGRVRRAYPIEGKGAGFFREFWKAATGEDIPIGETLDVDLDQAMGASVLVNVGNEDYQGRAQNTVEKVAAAA